MTGYMDAKFFCQKTKENKKKNGGLRK